jgi:hypothetical protein
MDACDKAAKLFQCGKENSPEAMAALMTSFENQLNNVFISSQYVKCYKSTASHFNNVNTSRKIKILTICFFVKKI